MGFVISLPLTVVPLLIAKELKPPRRRIQRKFYSECVWCHCHNDKHSKNLKRMERLVEGEEGQAVWGDSCTLILETITHFDRYTHYCFVFMPMESLLLLLLSPTWSQKSDYFRKVLLEL